MDPDVMRALSEAWNNLGPRILADPIELAARNARRRLDFMTHPARPWCLAVRACDTRITPMQFVMSPQRPVVWDAENRRRIFREHTVLLEKRVLRWLCRPISIPRPGLMADEVEKLLGTTKSQIRIARRRGIFSVRYVPLLAGRRGLPVPVLSTPRLLDPGAHPLGAAPFPEWGTHWRFISDNIPDDLSQPVTRRPIFGIYRGEEKFRGWRWLCPGCKRSTRIVFCPIPHLVADFVPHDHPHSPDQLESFPAVFGCRECIGVKSCPGASLHNWGQLVARLSGGLLFGHEVNPPKWWRPIRARKSFKRPGRAPSRRLPPIEHLLVQTNLTHRQIARELGRPLGSIKWLIHEIYKRRAVHSRQQLRAALPTQSPMKAAG